MIGKIIEWIKSRLTACKHDRSNEMVIDASSIIPEKVETEIHIPEIRIIEGFDPEKESILIIDDSKGIISIVEDYLDDCGILKDNYNILTFFDNYAPFVMMETLEELKREKGLKKIDYAVIDIVLPGKMKLDGKYVKHDGIDVAIWLNKNFDLENFFFYTGNIVSSYLDFINEKTEKFSNHFNRDMRDFINFKGGKTEDETLEEFCALFKKERYVL